MSNRGIFSALTLAVLLGCGDSAGIPGNAPEEIPLNPSKVFELPAAEIASKVKLAEAGDAGAAFDLSSHYGMWMGDRATMEKWLRRAAELGHPTAMWNLAYLMQEDADPSNDEEALKLIKTLADAGHETAKRHLERAGGEVNERR